MQDAPKYNRLLILILLIGLVLRIVVALGKDHEIVYLGVSGDPPLYLANGEGWFSGQEDGYTSYGLPFYNSQLPTAPLYIIFTGIWQVLLPDTAAVIAIRLVQSVASIVVAYLAYRMGITLTNDEQVGLVAAAALALHPAFILDAAEIATESLYIFFLAVGMWLYMEWVVAKQPRSDSRLTPTMMVVAVGLAFGLATLTRAVGLLFPLGIALHMLMIGGRKWLGRIVLLLVVYSAVVGTWTVTNLVRWEEARFVIASSELTAAIFRGTLTEELSPQDIDDRLLSVPDDPDCVQDCKNQITDGQYIDAISQTLQENPGGYIQTRLNQLAYAYFQPHGTVFLGGESIRAQTLDWWQNDRSIAGLATLVSGEQFLPKLAIYIFYYVGFIGGLVGMWLCRDRWRVALPMIGFILYTTLIHVILFVIPRYIFPTQVFFWVFAAVTLIFIGDRLRPHKVIP